MAQEVERYRKPTRVLHWIHSTAFVVLFITGLILFIPQLGFLAQDSWTRLLHRIAIVFFVGIPIIYLLGNWSASWKGIKDAFTWNSDDAGWLKAAPRYYFLCDEKAMPPQPHMNTGQKLWWLLVILGGLVFFITGLFMWLFKDVASAGLLQWMTFFHDIAFIATGCMFLVHIYMSVIHPLTRPAATGAWNSMARGTVSAEYAKSHHGKWYEEISKS